MRAEVEERKTGLVRQVTKLKVGNGGIDSQQKRIRVLLVLE
jgi:hypothetical protein